ncbi:arrestin domain-containing protein 4-like [Siphateles boraxobius]|uniref:arrestin domain-containing protein 4-like n=1 Tax=Siphateles boraxobius TaxID=180520 RepID=UPI004063DE0B
MDMSLLYPRFTLPDVAEDPPSYASVVSEEQFEDNRTPAYQPQPNWLLDGPAITYIQQFRLQPPPSYSEIYPTEH